MMGEDIVGFIGLINSIYHREKKHGLQRMSDPKNSLSTHRGKSLSSGNDRYSSNCNRGVKEYRFSLESGRRELPNKF